MMKHLAKYKPIEKIAESRYTWLSVKEQPVLYLNLQRCTEEEIMACGYLMQTKIAENHSGSEVLLLINLNKPHISKHDFNFSGFFNRLVSGKIRKKAFIGINGYSLAMASFINLRDHAPVRLFDSYTESINYLVEC